MGKYISKYTYMKERLKMLHSKVAADPNDSEWHYRSVALGGVASGYPRWRRAHTCTRRGYVQAVISKCVCVCVREGSSEQRAE